MKTLIATAILAMAIASPALAQRAQSAPQRGYPCGNCARAELKGRTHVRPFPFCTVPQACCAAGDAAGAIQAQMASDGTGGRAKLAETEADLTSFRCLSWPFAHIQNISVTSALLPLESLRSLSCLFAVNHVLLVDRTVDTRVRRRMYQ